MAPYRGSMYIDPVYWLLHLDRETYTKPNGGTAVAAQFSVARTCTCLRKARAVGLTYLVLPPVYSSSGARQHLPIDVVCETSLVVE